MSFSGCWEEEDEAGPSDFAAAGEGLASLEAGAALEDSSSWCKSEVGEAEVLAVG